LLDESLVFSQRADDTIGSTCGIVAGEKIVIRELLYGLLLPSGNDAAVAIAEFFGGYVESDRDDDHDQDNAAGLSAAKSYDRFIAAMNRTARELRMDAAFVNPHGLTAPGHVASAESLAMLARAAMQNPFFREIVNTRQRGYRLESPSGYTRNIVWKNTNRLLGIEGYLGVKTGTTNAAGACLVSYVEREDDALIAVVLGSSSSDARYTDTRNLFRWAWNARIETEVTGAAN
jgi:D-alanyl-D-alanine carboxypeptidase (penicillin-binding protein 5/6)